MNLRNQSLFVDLWPKDWILRFIAMFLAVVVWYFVGGEDRVDKNVMIPVEVINLPRDLVIANQYKRTIEVSVSGPRSQVLSLAELGVQRQIDLSHATAGTMVITNDNDSIPVPRGVTVLRVQPATIILSLDNLVQKFFEINEVTRGNVAPDHVLKSIRVDPDVISITGPQDVLSRITDIKTKTIDLSGLHQPIQIQIPLDISPEIIELIGETSVTADINIGPETVEKKISSLPVELVDAGVAQRVSPPAVSVTVELPKSFMRTKPDLKNLFQIRAGAAREDGQAELWVKAKPGFDIPFSVVGIEPPTVFVIQELPQQNTSEVPEGENESTSPPAKKNQ
ncbi:MAG: YbbR-like domain-containing protein [Desulfobulbaceae bacterium]|uniref:YbbR-like domain-containing protein n=1 Tax=Candidatus Desulfatifera sulfidica TaxID=2841691 RepID=A0A8J6TA80_9BACT|nr:YbbR-like domain-containing protein [Candidatus Desulfatifera sulfidica]